MIFEDENRKRILINIAEEREREKFPRSNTRANVDYFDSEIESMEHIVLKKIQKLIQNYRVNFI